MPVLSKSGMNGAVRAIGLAAMLSIPAWAGAVMAQDPQTLTIWAGNYTPSRLLPLNNDPNAPKTIGIDNVVAAYQAAHPNVSIQLITQPINQDSRRWLVTQLTGGVAPDIIWNQPDWAAEDYRKSWIVPLDSYLAKPDPYVAAGDPGSEKWHDLFMPAIDVWKAADEHLYVVLADQVQVGIYYNKDLLAKAGVTSPPTTWEEFMQDAEKVKATGAFPFAASGNNLDQLTWVSGWLTNFYYHSKLATYDLDGDGVLSKTEMAKAVKAGTYAFNDKENRDRLEQLKRFASYWQPGALAADINTAQRLFQSGRAAFFISGTWANATILNDKARNFDFDVFYFPRVTSTTAPAIADDVPLTNKAAGYGQFQFSVTQAAVERGTADTAFDFLMYATAPKNLGPMIVETSIALPAVKGAESNPNLEKFAESVAYPAAPFQEDDSMFDFEFAQKFLAITSPYLGGTQNLDDTAAKLDVEMQAAADRVLAE
jgi:ABC-type glycerol-3-phosphate transport system substrate-binding protein